MATRPPSASGTSDPRDDAFLREVDEAYREDELKKFFQSYGRWILLGVTAGLVGLGGYLWWQSSQTKAAEAASEQFTAALDQVDAGSTTEAVASLQAVASGDSAGYSALARFAEAGVAVNGGDTTKANALYKAVAEDAKAPQALRDAALMKYLRLSFDTLQPAEIISKTAPFLSGDHAWFPIAGELAALAHVKAGNGDKAGPIFYRIAGDERAPASLRARAEQMASALGQDVTKLIDAREKAAANAAAGEAAADPAPAAETAEQVEASGQ